MSRARHLHERAKTNLDLSNDESQTFWLVISALTNDTPSHKIVLGATPLNVLEGGEGVELTSVGHNADLHFTAAQSDARYARTVDLTG